MSSMTFKIDMENYVVSFYKKDGKVEIELFDKRTKEPVDYTTEKPEMMRLMGDILGQ